MRPILAVIPRLPFQLLLPLAALVVVAALFSVVVCVKKTPDDKFSAIAAPLFTAAGVLFLMVLWSRHSITLHSYGLFLILGFAAATYSACLEAKRKGYDPNLILDLALPLLGASILACRLLYVILNHNEFHSIGDVVRVWDGGLSFHGSLVAAPLVVWFYAARNRLTFWQLADIIAPSVFIGYAIGRLGCLFNGCCYGVPCDLPWAMRFPDEFNRHIMTPPSHPTQLYSVILGLLLFWGMQRAKMSPRWTRFHGELTLLFFALYALERAFVEYFRNGATAITVLGQSWLTQAQLASGIALVVIAAIWLILDNRARPQLRGQSPNPEAR